MAFLFAFSVNAQDCYLAGTMNGWSTNSTKLNKNGGQYELVLKLDKDVEFKVVYNGNWYGFDKIKNGGDLVSNNGGNIKTKTKNCYGIYFKPDNNGEIYLTHAENCPEPFSFWGFDILYQEGTTKKWASTKSTANRWDGNFILTSTDNEVFDLGIVKRGTKFIGFRAYTNDNGSDVQGMYVFWSDVDVNAPAIEGGNYGKWNNDGTNGGSSGGTDEVWDVTDRSSKFMGYENGEYSFNLNFELKVNGNEKTLVRTIKIKYTINEFELTADLNGPCYVGDQVKLTVEGGTSPYTWQTSSDGVSWNTLSGVTGTTYTHKVADKIYFRVKDSDSKTTGMVELTPSIKCDPNHTITVFKETFGTLSSVDARTSYSKSNVPVEGHSEITYSARIPSYTVSTVECGAMTDAGRYAVLANPRNAGCGTDIAQDTKNCGCYNSSERWYRDTEDHTSGDTNGGMLMYNCADGTKTTPDVLYECTINGICARTYINFSAFVTCANTGRSGNIPIEAEFKLYSGTTATGIPLSIIPVKNIGLNTTWKEISAMFNSGIATTVTIQLVNKAADGQGNDLLLDDITLSICTPEASLVCSDGVTTEKTIFAGESEELTSYIMSGIMEDPYYLWLTSEDNNADIKEWDVVDNPAKTVLSVSPTKTTYYKVIISNTKEEAEAVYKKETSTACGMHAITNTVTINIAALPISFTTHPSDVIVCEGSEATFSVVATNADNYQWQKSTNNVAWIDIEGETATSYVIRETTKNDDKTYYRVKTTNAYGTVAYSNSAKLTVNSKATISNITAPSAICAGSALTLPTLNITNNGSTVTNGKWYLDGSLYTDGTAVEYNKNGKTLQYKATSSCGGAIQSNAVSITVNDKATISNITDPSAICAGSALTLPTLNITNNGSTVTNGKWYLDGSVYTEGTVVEYNKNGKTLLYKATSSCGGAIQSNAVSITVNDKATISNITAPSAICAGSALTLPTLNITNNGSTVTNGKWYLDGSVYTEGTAVEYNKNGKTLQYKATSSCGGAIQSNAVAITVNDKPTITINNTPEDLYCAGMQYTLPNVSVNYNGSDKKTEVEGWYLDGQKLPSNNVTFTLGDAGKTLVYKASNTCGETEREFISSLVVEDCADLVLVYSLDNSDYCAGDEAVLTATIKNNGTTDLSGVKLNQTWSRAQDNVTTTQTVGTYANNIWSIPTLAIGETATLTITFNATTSEEFKIYVTAANGVTYSSYDASVAKATTNLVVKEISSNVVANNYISCPTDGAEFPITDLVTSNEDQLSVMGKNESTGEYYALTAVPMVNPSVQTASTTYYITKTENGKCESATPTPITIEVYKPVTASISGISPLCSGEISNVTITLDGTPGFEVVYNNGAIDVTKTISGTTLNITESLTSTTTYKLVSVTDYNNCQAYLDGTELVTVTVNPRPELESFEIEDADDIICEGESTTLKATFKGTAPFSFKINGEEKRSDATEWSMTISDEKEYVITDLSDVNCSAETISNNSATLTVEEIPVVTLSTTSAELDCNTEEITLVASGAHSYSWTDNKNSAPTSGDKLVAKRTDTETTIYTVVGTSQHGCASDEVSVTVKENFVAPTVELKPQLQPNGEPWPTELTCRMKRIPVVADTENSLVDIVKYEWSNGLSTTEYTELSTKGKHTVTVTAKNGCTATSSIEITENVVNPILSVEHIGSRSKKETTVLNCFDQYNYVTPSVSNVSEIGGSIEYFWYKNGREYFYGDYLEISEAGTYMILANGANDCEATYTLVLTEDKERPEAEIVASAETVTCSTPEVELTVKTDVDCNYFWTGVGGEEAKKQTIKVSKGDTYQVFVQSNANGCITTLDYTLDEKTDLPVVEITASAEKVTCNPNTLTASGAKTYVWSTGDTTESTQVTEGGLYTVEGTNEYGCKSTAEIELEADQLIPAISLTSDTTTVTCRKETVLITAEVTNNDGARTYTYVWTQDGNSTSVTASTFDAQTAATYKVTITDETNACKAEKTINIKENKQNPLIDIKSLPSVCLPATVDLKDAVGPNTKADEVKYFADATLTQQLTDTNIEAAANAVYYVVGYEIDNNGCVGDPIAIPVVLKPSTSKPVVENYDECAEVGTKTLSSLVKSDKTKLVFFEDETSEAPIADLFSTSAENTTTTYWVSNTKTGACESERVAIEVNIAGYIDFSVEASQTRLPAGQEVTITVTPLSDTPVDEYVWYRGDEVVQATDELELTEQLYLNEKYSVQAVGRCNSPKKEVDVEAIWPTAFTPHNGNGKNDSFADGMNIIVFNRFYTKIYEGPDGWDGSINGAMNDGKETAVPGVYYYSVQLPNGQVKKGTIEIVKVD